MSCAIKQHNPDCHVIGVEPVGADTMHRSFASGKPESIDAVNTIADSLGAPYAAEYSLSVCMEFVDELVLVDDPALCEAMAVLFNDLKLAVEPAAAAATAALAGPLRGRFEGKRVGLICCGANISVEKFCSYVA
jgi:threonine dehydratase